MFSGASRTIPSFGDLAWKKPVPSVSIGALSANTLAPAAGVSFGQTLTKNANGALSGEANIISLGGLTVGDRILITSEASPKNGVYTITALGLAGGGGSPWVLTRAKDADTSNELPGGTLVFDLALNALWLSTVGNGGAFSVVPNTVGLLNIRATSTSVNTVRPRAAARIASGASDRDCVNASFIASDRTPACGAP